MSDPKDILGFQEVDDGLDIDAIFGRDADISTPLPPLAVPQPAEAGEKTEPEETAAAPDESASEETAEKPAEKETDTEQDLFAAFSDSPTGTAPDSETAEGKVAPEAEKPVSLFDRPAIFKYGSAKEPITDASMTFEELRIKKADDFPELEEGKKVSWSVKYGDVTKSIALPKETTIAKIKEEIEKSRAFLDSLKKGKVKDPECLVTPKVTAGSKGIAAYKSMPTTEESRRLLAKLVGAHHALLGIPGFYTRYGRWTIAGPNGFLIPVRNRDSQIQGLKIRLDDETNPNRKYRWLSSRDRHFENGTRSYSWIHVTGNRSRKRAFLTEGPLKGDVASFLANDALFICTGGVSAIKGLRETILELGVNKGIIR